MYKLVFGSKFLRSAEKLDKRLKLKLKSSLDVLSQNPFHPNLHTKSLSGKLAGFYSFRLSRDYRVIFELISSEGVIYLLKVGDRKDIYR